MTRHNITSSVASRCHVRALFAAVALPSFLFLAACGGGGGSSMVTSTTAMKSVMSSDTNPRPEDFELSCAEIETRLGNLQARYDELAAEQKKKQRGKSLLSGLVSSTIGIVGGTAAAATGSAQGVQAVGTATHAASYAASDLASSESDSDALRAIGEIQPLAERIVQLSKVSTEKGC